MQVCLSTIPYTSVVEPKKIVVNIIYNFVIYKDVAVK